MQFFGGNCIFTVQIWWLVRESVHTILYLCKFGGFREEGSLGVLGALGVIGL